MSQPKGELKRNALLITRHCTGKDCAWRTTPPGDIRRLGWRPSVSQSYIRHNEMVYRPMGDRADEDRSLRKKLKQAEVAKRKGRYQREEGPANIALAVVDGISAGRAQTRGGWRIRSKCLCATDESMCKIQGDWREVSTGEDRTRPTQR